MNIFKEVVHSCYDIKSYALFLKNGRLKTFLYGLLIGLIGVCVQILLPVALVIVPFGGITPMAESLIPEFRLEDGRLWTEEPVEYTTYSTYLKIDTSSPVTEEVTDTQLLFFDNALVLDAEHVICKYEGEVYRLSYADLNLGNWTRESMLETFGSDIRLALGVILMAVSSSYILGFFIGVLILAMIGSILASILKFRMGFGDLFKLAVHGRTAPILLMMLLNFFGLAVPFATLFSFGLSSVYMWKAIRYIKEQNIY